MKAKEDLFWEQVIETLDLAPGELAQAEKVMAQEAGGQAAVPPAAVRHGASGQGAESRKGQVVRRGGLVRRWPRAAALVLGAGLLAAAGGWLLWGGKNSDETLPYELAIEDLSSHGQPVNHRHSALKVVFQGAVHGIKALTALSKNAAETRRLRDAASSALASLRATLASGELSVRAIPNHQALLRAAEFIADPNAGEDERLKRIAELKQQVAIGIYTITQARGLTGEAAADKARSLQKLTDRLTAK